MQGQRIGYIRVSSFDQNPDRQLEQIEVGKVFTDKASGKDTQRPELERGRLRKRNLKYVKHAPRLAPSGIALERTRRDFWSRPWAERSPSESFDAKTSAVHF